MYKYLLITLLFFTACSKSPYHDSQIVCVTSFGSLKADFSSVKYIDQYVVTIDEGLDEVIVPLSTCIAVRDK